jgi:hypothetical protein
MTSVMVWRKNRKIPISYFILLQVFKYIKQFKPDKIFIAADGGSSWRKAIYPEYKANRKGFRDSFPDIDWNQVFADYNTLLQNIQSFTPIAVVHIPNIEGDDIISYICRYCPTETVVVSKDHDIQQLLALPYVSLYLVKPKNKSELLTGKTNDVLDDKIKNGDVSDNIPKAESFSEAVRNEVLVDLFNLPKTIDLTIKNHIESIKKAEDDGTFQTIYKFKFLNEVYPLLTKKEDSHGTGENRNSSAS